MDTWDLVLVHHIALSWRSSASGAHRRWWRSGCVRVVRAAPHEGSRCFELLDDPGCDSAGQKHDGQRSRGQEASVDETDSEGDDEFSDLLHALNMTHQRRFGYRGSPCPNPGIPRALSGFDPEVAANGLDESPPGRHVLGDGFRTGVRSARHTGVSAVSLARLHPYSIRPPKRAQSLGLRGRRSWVWFQIRVREKPSGCFRARRGALRRRSHFPEVWVPSREGGRRYRRGHRMNRPGVARPRGTVG